MKVEDFKMGKLRFISNTKSHAEREFALLKQTDEIDLWMQANVLELIKVFGSQGHSGFSAPYCIDLFSRLARFEVLSPLTGEDNEWTDTSMYGCPETSWQNNRCSAVFKNDKGECYYIDGKVFREPNGSCYTNGDSIVPVTFPFTPKTEYIDVPETKEASMKLALYSHKSIANLKEFRLEKCLALFGRK